MNVTTETNAEGSDHAACRVDRPYVRKGWLEGRRRGALRGGDPFVPLSWDRAVRLVAEETRRVRAEHGPNSIFGGSYGWSSAGRFHHARTQLQRFLGLGGGYTAQVNAYSYAAAQALLPHIVGTNEILLGRVTDWDAIRVEHCIPETLAELEQGLIILKNILDHCNIHC